MSGIDDVLKAQATAAEWKREADEKQEREKLDELTGGFNMEQWLTGCQCHECGGDCKCDGCEFNRAINF